LDIVPYGGVERPDRTIAWPPAGNLVMSVLGFAEVAATAVPVVLPGGFTVPVVPLHALALLKLVAWDDRWRRAPGKDAPDLFVMAKKYLAAGNEERLFNMDWEVLDRPDFDYEVAEAEMLGHDLASLCYGTLEIFLIALLARETDPGGSLLMAYQMTNDEEEGLRILMALRRGFEANRAERRNRP
jgi:predicted nucleotidyltransferase